MSIGYHTFYHCEKLNSTIIFNNYIENFCDYVFYHCYELEKIIFNDDVGRIGANTIINDYKLTTILYYGHNEPGFNEIPFQYTSVKRVYVTKNYSKGYFLICLLF